MSPDTKFEMIKDDDRFYIGETKDKQPQGHGISIWFDGDIEIGKQDGIGLGLGKYVNILSNGEIDAGEIYLDAKQELRDRCTTYKTNGTTSYADRGMKY